MRYGIQEYLIYDTVGYCHFVCVFVRIQCFYEDQFVW